MDTRNGLETWLFLEFVLVLPGLLTGAAFVFRRWVFPAFAMFTEDVYMGAVAFPFMGAVVGGVVAFGVSDVLGGDMWPGVGYVFAGLGIAAYAGGLAVKERAKAERTPPDSFSVPEWRRDVDHLSRLRRLSSADRHEFAQRARELADRGGQAIEEARRHRFGAYWRERHRAQVWAYAWVAAGVLVAAKGTALFHSPWYLAFSVTGGSVVLMMWLSWYDARMVKTTEGNAQIRASELIQHWLDRLPDDPVPSLRQRLAMLISPRRAAAPDGRGLPARW
jgi:hypothetical protein